MRLWTGKSSGFCRVAAVLVAAAIVVVLPAAGARGQEWGPWENGRPAASEADAPAGGPAGLPLIALIRAYQAWLSPVYGDRCPMTPSCSHYAVDAIRKHGPIVGIVMTSGRLMHEADERKVAPIRKTGERYLFFDPVENNDFWFAAR